MDSAYEAGSEKCFERRDNFFSNVRLNGVQHPYHVLPEGGPVRESYGNGGCDANLILRLIKDDAGLGVDAHPAYYCVRFHSASRDEELLVVEPGIEVGMDCDTFKIHGGEMDKSMLVHVREFIQEPQRFVDVLPVCVVGLQPYYDFLCFRLKKLESELSLPGEFVSVTKNRELWDLLVILASELGIELGKFKDNVVERASEVLDNITDEQRKRLGGDWVGAREHDQLCRVCWVGFNAGGTVFGVDPIDDFRIEVLKVFMSPFDLEDVALFWGRHNRYPFFMKESKKERPKSDKKFNDTLKNMLNTPPKKEKKKKADK